MVDASRIEQTSLSETQHTWSKSILYVEDEAFVREVTQEVLEAAGYRVFSVGDAAQAQQICRERCPHIDVLLTDVVLPERMRVSGEVEAREPEPASVICCRVSATS